MSYLPRIVDQQLAEGLHTTGAVLLEGPKACGKTLTALQAANSSVRFDVDEAARIAAEIDPTLVLEGPAPRLLDEWQRAPRVWDAVRRAVDDRQQRGQFILTGSAAPADDLSGHSGAMRILRIAMRPMTLAESGAGTGEVSFSALARGDSVRATDPSVSLHVIASWTARGGWPGNLDLTDARALRQLRAYVGEIARVDLTSVDGVPRDPQAVMRLLRSLARNVGTPVSTSAIRRDVNGADGSHKDETVAAMMHSLTRLMVLEELPAWAPSIRSRTRLRASAVRHFVDPSLAVAALGADAQKLTADPEWFGFLFEGMVLRDIRVYAEAVDGQVYHYRDESGLEADIVVEFPDGTWMAIEVKLGQGSIDDAASGLLRLRDRVDTDATGEPVALVVVTPSGLGYVRPDGVRVVPAVALTA